MMDVKEEWVAKSVKLEDHWSAWMVADVKGPFYSVLFTLLGAFFCL
jgi:hypothetical protein